MEREISIFKIIINTVIIKVLIYCIIIIFIIKYVISSLYTIRSTIIYITLTL